jgi:RNA polymerase sigma factor (sigma-70 family)
VIAVQGAKTNGWLDEIRDLKKSYRGTYWLLRRARDKTNDPAELEIIKDMIADVNFAIQWMHTGRLPGSRRGIDRRAAYQRNKLVDPLIMQAFANRSTAGSPANISEDERAQIEMALCTLSERERDCYQLAHGECFSFADIAGMLGITKSSVQEYVERAHKKVSEELENNMFLRR